MRQLPTTVRAAWLRDGYVCRFLTVTCLWGLCVLEIFKQHYSLNLTFAKPRYAGVLYFDKIRITLFNLQAYKIYTFSYWGREIKHAS